MYPLVKMKFGSHVYGTNTPQSDTDYKGVYLPPAHELIYGNALDVVTSNTKSNNALKNSADDIDMEFYSLKKYMKLLLEGQTVAIDMFFTPKEFYEESTPMWDDIQSMYPDWLHKSITPFVGYCMRQASKYGIKGSRVAAARKAMEFFGDMDTHVKLSSFWPQIVDTFTGVEHCEISNTFVRQDKSQPVRMLDVCGRKVQEHIKAVDAYKIYQNVFKEYGARALQAETNENVDWKAMSHAVRIAEQAIELLVTEKISFPRPNAEYLLKIKKGLIEYKLVAEELEDLLVRLHIAQSESPLPAQPNHAMARDIVTANYTAWIVTNILPGFNDHEKVSHFVMRSHYPGRKSPGT